MLQILRLQSTGATSGTAGAALSLKRLAGYTCVYLIAGKLQPIGATSDTAGAVLSQLLSSKRLAGYTCVYLIAGKTGISLSMELFMDLVDVTTVQRQGRHMLLFDEPAANVQTEESSPWKPALVPVEATVISLQHVADSMGMVRKYSGDLYEKLSVQGKASREHCVHRCLGRYR